MANVFAVAAAAAILASTAGVSHTLFSNRHSIAGVRGPIRLLLNANMWRNMCSWHAKDFLSYGKIAPVTCCKT